MVPQEEQGKGPGTDEVGQPEDVFAANTVGDRPGQQRPHDTAQGHETKSMGSSFEG